jgi:FtsP/CotA-like multicopper oxidase with cupredoxin domain
VVVAAVAWLLPGGAGAQARIDGIQVADGSTLDFTAGAGELSTPDGGSVHFWGYQDLGNTEGVGLPQYPGPTLILTQGSTVTVTLASNLPFGRCTSIVFPGHAVIASGGNPGLLTRQACPGDAAPVSYTFTASRPGTYAYHSGTQAELQVEMGLVGAIIVRPSSVPAGGAGTADQYAYDHAGTFFDHETLFLLTSLDPTIHALAEQGRFVEIDVNRRWPVYWLINGRAAPDDLAAPFVTWLPHQPYNSSPRMTPGQKLLVRIIGADQDQHPLHLHGNHYAEIARYGRLLTLADGTTQAPRMRFTTLSVPGQTVDAIFEWTGEKLGWDIYGTPLDNAPSHACNGIDLAACLADGNPSDCGSAGHDPATNEYCPDHGKRFPVTLPATQNLALGGWWSGSPFLGLGQPLPPGEGGLNPNNGFFFMWHSHTEKELTNFDIFPGGMMSMMVVEPPGTPIP